MKLPRFIEKIFVERTENGDPIEGAMKMVGNIQKLVGIRNMFEEKRRSITIFTLLLTIIIAGSFIYVGSLSQIIYMHQVFPDKTETFKAMNCISATCVPLSKYIFMWTSRSRLRTIFEMSRQGLSSIPPSSSARIELMDTLKKARYASWLVVVNQGFSHVMYLVTPILFTLLTDERYLPTTPGDPYGLSPKTETPFYEITYTLTTIGTAFSAINQTGYIVLFVTLLAHDLGHFYAITVTLNDIHQSLHENQEKSSANSKNSDKTRPSSLNNLKTPEDIVEKLRFCVKHYQFLLKYHYKIRELYKVIFGAHFLMMVVVIVTTLQTMNEWDARNTILTGFTGILPLFIYCFGGELIISAGVEMSNAVYGCGWELMEVKQAKIVLFMLCVSQRPLYLTAADIFIMNRETFGNIAQVVYKIYAVFN